MLHDESPPSFHRPGEDELIEMLGYREGASEASSAMTEGPGAAADWRDVISQRAYDFIVGWETGGKAYYERVIKSRPVWPEFSSGITIGCGYDLGFHTDAQFRSDWQGRIADAAIERLRPTVGFRTDEPNRRAKVAKARALVTSLQDISVPWEVAIRQFDESKMPKLLAELHRALDNLDRLHPHARGALLSLIFNRGTGGFSSGKDRFREMVAIHRRMASGRPQDVGEIPSLLRAMTRVWGEESSLAKRRRQEAELFEAGLAETGLTESLSALVNPEMTESPGPMTETHADLDVPASDQEDDTQDGFEMLEAPGPGLGDVRWNPNDDDQPDYRHLPKPDRRAEFDLVPGDLEALIRLNAFAPLPGRLVFALRGARLVGADRREDVASVTLADQRPDHRDFRCVIGVLDRDAGRMWAYRASTVPEAKSLIICFQKAQQGAELSGNILPTGLYTYTVGTHRAGTSGEIRGVLRLANTLNGASRVIALRSLSDVAYDIRDFWHSCAPADNIHPGRRRQGFSSLGCLTLPGDYERGSRKHTGLWADFRVALGMGRVFAPSDDGRKFSVMLLTGLDAALASSLRESGDSTDAAAAGAALRRLRVGSRGASVARLQEQLGLEPDDSQLIGPVTRAALIALQQRRLGWADGILSPETQGDLGLSVLD